MDRRGIAFLVAVLVLAVSVVVFIQPDRPTPDDSAVIASIHPVASIVGEIAGDKFRVECLIPPGASPHTFEPTTRQMRIIASARAFFRIGLGLESWADGIIKSSASSDLEVVTLSDGIDRIRVAEEGADHGHHGHEHHHHDHGEFNPHVWLDPVHAKKIVAAIAQTLSKIDPTGCPEYSKRAQAYVAELDAIDRSYREGLVVLKDKPLVTFHNAYDYVARRYGLTIAGVIQESPGKEPGAKHIRETIATIKKLKVAAVLVEPQFSPRMAEAIAHDCDIPVVTVDPLGNPRDPDRATYLDLLRHNLKQLVKAGGGK